MTKNLRRKLRRQKSCLKCSCIVKVVLARFVAPSKDSQVRTSVFFFFLTSSDVFLLWKLFVFLCCLILDIVGISGVEDILTDCKSHKVVVKGEKADPLKVLERLQKKSHRKVELLSPIPKPPTEEEKKPQEEQEKPKPEEKKEEVHLI